MNDHRVSNAASDANYRTRKHGDIFQAVKDRLDNDLSRSKKHAVERLFHGTPSERFAKKQYHRAVRRLGKAICRES